MENNSVWAQSFFAISPESQTSQINVVGQLGKLITQSVLELEVGSLAEYVCSYVLFCLKSNLCKLVPVEVNRGQKVM